MKDGVRTLDKNEEVKQVLARQKRAHQICPYPSLKDRLERINRLISMVVSNKDVYIDAAMSDFENRSPMVTKFTDIVPTLDNLKYVKKNLHKWMKPERRKSKFPLGLIGSRSRVEYIPLGVVGNIAPWNFPIQLSISPMADILGAGNRIMLKPSELSPNTSSVLSDSVKEWFDEDEIAVVTGGPDVSSAFSRLKFDHLLFTGSTSVARLVSQSAAPNLVPLTLELGGKNPTVISRSADIKIAAEKIAWAKSLNGGQICLCPDLVYIHEKDLEDFIESYRIAFNKMYPNPDVNPEYTHIISARHAERLRAMLSESVDLKARIVHVAGNPGRGRRVLPSLIINPPQGSRVMQEEIFGNLLPVVTYTDFDTIVTSINQNSRPLALYYFGNCKAEATNLTHNVACGGMVVNDLLAHILQDDLPFGGVGDSGMGCYHGYDGFKNFSHGKAVYTQSKLDPLKILRPPYSGFVESYIDKQIKN